MRGYRPEKYPARNRLIEKLICTMSYGAVAKRLGITRSTVAGVAYREVARASTPRRFSWEEPLDTPSERA